MYFLQREKDKLEAQARVAKINKHHAERSSERRRLMDFNRRAAEKKKQVEIRRLKKKLEEEASWKKQLDAKKKEEDAAESIWRRADFMKSVDFEKMCEEMRNADDGDARRVTIQGLENIKKAKKETRNNRR